MTSPMIDPRLVHALSAEFVALQQHLYKVGRDLDTLRGQLTAPPQYVPQPMPQRAPQPQPQPQPQPRYTAPPPPVVRTPTEPWWQRDGVISRILAVAGAAVTLVGVAMLVVLAVQAGWFGPELRVGSGAVLSGVLVYCGHRLIARPGGRVGAVALGATGMAGLYLVVAATTSIYGWIAPAFGLVVALGVAGLGVAIAMRWASQHLAVMVTVGVAVLAPVVTQGLSFELIALMFVVQLAAAPVDLHLDWKILRVVRTVPVVFWLLVAGALAEFSDAGTVERVQITAIAAAVYAVALVSAAITLRRTATDIVSTVSIGLCALPVMVSATLFGAAAGAGIDVALAVASLVAVAVARWLSVPARVVLVVIAAGAVLQACSVVSIDDLRAALLLALALALIVGAAYTKSVAAWGVGAVFAVVGLLDHMASTPTSALVHSADADLIGWGSVLGSVLLIGIAVAGAYAASTVEALRSSRELVVVVSAAVGLYAVSAVAVTVGVLVGGASTGFVVGHCAATVVWMATAVTLLLRGLSSSEHAHGLLLGGLVLASAATAKLFLFDLVALGGIARAAAFLAVGVMLLAIGTRYARAFAERRTENSDAAAGGAPTAAAGAPEAR